MEIKRIEQGYPGHFIAAERCGFRRNTALVHEDGRALLVSSVGAYRPVINLDGGTFETVGSGRYFECMAFVAEKTDCGCYQIDVSRQIHAYLPWAVPDEDDHAAAQVNHESQVEYWTEHFEQAFVEAQEDEAS